MNLERYSDTELMRIAGLTASDAGSGVSSLSDDTLFKIAGLNPSSSPSTTAVPTLDTAGPRAQRPASIAANEPGFWETLASPIIGTPGERTILGRAIYGPERVAQPLARGEQAGAPQTEGYDLPAVRLEEFVPRGNVGTEFTRGVLSAGSGLTTPSSAVLLGGVGAATKLGSQVLSRLISAGFAADMAHALYEQVGAFKEAADAGDYQAAANLAGQATATGLFTAGAAHHALQPGGWFPSRAAEGGTRVSSSNLTTEPPVKHEVQVNDLVEGVKSPAAALPDAELMQIAGIPADAADTIKASEPAPPAPPKRGGPKLAVVGDAPDLLNMIDQMGGLRPRPKKGVYDEANYDGWDEVMKEGPARLLARHSGLAPDDMRQALANVDLPLGSTSEMYAAIAQALESRRGLKGQMEDDRATQAFSAAAYENKGKSGPQKSNETLTVASLKIGDRFRIKGEPFEVSDVTIDGEVIVQDGRKFPPQTLLDGQTIFPDRESVVEAPADVVDFPYAKEEGAIPSKVREGTTPQGRSDLRQPAQVEPVSGQATEANKQEPVRVVAHFANGQTRSARVRTFDEAVWWAFRQEEKVGPDTLTQLRTPPTESFPNGGLLGYRDAARVFHRAGSDAEMDAKMRQFGPPSEKFLDLSDLPGQPPPYIDSGHFRREPGLKDRTFAEITREVAPEPGKARYSQQGLEFKGEPLAITEQQSLFGQPEEKAPAAPEVRSMAELAKAMADAGARERETAEAELIRQGKGKNTRRLGDVRGPLFGNEEPGRQGGLFGNERGVLNLEGLAPAKQIDYSGIDDAKPPKGPGVVERAKERTASWADRTIRRTTDRFVDLRRLVERAAAQDLLKSNPDFQRWNEIDQDMLAVEQEIGDLEGSSRAVTRRSGMRETTSIPLTRADADRLATLRTERGRLQAESEALGRKISGNPFQKLAREVEARRAAARLSADVDPAKQAQIAYGGGLGRAQLGQMDYGDVFREARQEGVGDGLTVYLRLAAKERGLSVVEEKLADRKKTIRTLGPKLRDLDSQIGGLEADLKTRKFVGNAPRVEATITRRNELKLEALKKLRNDVKAELENASFEADRFQRLLDQRQAVPDNETHATIAAKVAQLRARAPEKFAAIETAAKRVFALNRQALDLAFHEGLISEEAYNKWTDRGDAYVPLTRLIEEAAIDHGEGPKPGTFQAKQQFQPLEGGSRELEDPLRASMDRFQSIVKQVEKNRVVRNIVTWAGQHKDLMEARPLDKDEKPGAQEGELGFYYEGKLQRFAVDKTLADVLTMSPPHIADFTGGALIQFASRVAKAGITGVNLAFAVPNVVRDVKTLAMTSKAGVRNPLEHPGDLGRLVKLWVDSLVHQSNQDPHFREFLESGAAFSTLQSNLTPEYFSRMKQRTNFNPFYWFAQVNQRMEQATKLASFRLNRERGMTPAESAWETRNFGGSPDFGRRGTQGPVWNALFLYFNARLQGTIQTVQGGTRDPMRLGYLLASYTAAALALQAWNSQFKDDQGKKEWDRLSDHDRQQYQVILLPGTEQKSDGSVRHEAVKIPKSHFEQLWFNPVQETISRLFGGKNDALQTGLDFTSNLTPMSGQVRRGSVARDTALGAVSSLNPLLKEGIEQFSNFDSYRKRPLVPQRLEKLDPRYQYNQNTSEISKRLGQAAGWSPLRLDHAAQTFGGGTSEAVLSVGDAFLKDTARQPREGQEKLTRLPVVGAILRRFIGTSGDQVAEQRMDGFYAMKAKADEVAATYRDRAKADPTEARRYLDEDPSHRALLAPAARKRIESMNDALNRVHSQARQVAESRLPDAAKKQKARELARLEANVLAQAEQLAEQLGVSP